MRKLRIVKVLALLLFFYTEGNAQEKKWVYPLRTTPLLSGNFGELRGTHLHTGVDFKTEGREGLPVLCVEDGVLARVSVSPGGYGHALYFMHAGGLTTVYGHLSRFAPKIAGLVRELQYAGESFAIDENVLSREIIYYKGDTIAYSGNTGSSGGPHLHFEVRDSWSEYPLNPLKYLGVTDREAPLVKGAYVYGFSADGFRFRKMRVELDAAGGRRFKGKRLGVPSGRIAFGVQAEDRMTGSTNKLGLYRLQIRVNGQEVYSFNMDTLAFGMGGYVNAVRDYALYKEGKQVYTGFGCVQDQLTPVAIREGGFFVLEQDSVACVEMLLGDFNGNVSEVSFEVVGGAPLPDHLLAEGEVFIGPEKSYIIKRGDYLFRVDSGALLSPRVCLPEVRQQIVNGREMTLFSLLAPACPLLKAAVLRVAGAFPEKSLLCMLDSGKRLIPLVTRRDEGGLEASVKTLGEYTVCRDTVSPVVVFLGVAGRRVRFRIRDEFSGISRYRVEVNGKWCLFAYDPKRLLLEGRLDEPAFKKGVNRIRVSVHDMVGNNVIFEAEIIK